MNSIRSEIAFVILIGVCSVSHVPAFAQSNTARERDDWHSSQAAVRTYFAVRETDDDVLGAPNLQISTAYQPLIKAMLLRSPTFRRQYARLARSPLVPIVIRADMPGGRAVQALTEMSARGGRVEALVHVMPSTRSIELISHELEHIIEQLDGVNLRAKSRLRASGVGMTPQAGTF